jgi:DNA-binding transcriptional LysR family regulator
MSLNLVQLEYVRAVAREGSFSGAARACGVSQPTVSCAVAELEQTVGGPLFRRTTRGVELTVLGRALLPHVESVLGAAGDFEREIEVLRNPERKLLRLAFSPMLDSRTLNHLGGQFSASHPGLEVVYKECTTDDLKGRVAQSQVDVVFAPRIVGDDDWARRALYRERMRYLPRSGGRGGATVTLAEVAKDRLLLTQPICGLAQTIRGWFERRGLPLDEYPGKAMSYAALEEWADLGLGGTILPESKLGERAHAFPLVVDEGAPLLVAYEAMWSRELTLARHVREFIQHLARPAARLFGRSDGIWEHQAPQAIARPRRAAR